MATSHMLVEKISNEDTDISMLTLYISSECLGGVFGTLLFYLKYNYLCQSDKNMFIAWKILTD